jgi:hypothetical protein
LSPSATNFTYLAVAPTTSGMPGPGSGPAAGGTTVTITGSGFLPADACNWTAIWFGGVQATSVAVLSDSMQACVAPPSGFGPGTVLVLVHKPWGLSAGNVSFTFQ